MEPFRSQVKAPVRCASPEPEATAGSWEKGRNKSRILKCSIDIHMYHICMCICTGTCRCITGITHLYISLVVAHDANQHVQETFGRRRSNEETTEVTEVAPVKRRDLARRKGGALNIF